MYSHHYSTYGLSGGFTLDDSKEETEKKKRNYQKIEEIKKAFTNSFHDFEPWINKLNDVYKVVQDYEDKDDEFQDRASGLTDKYTDFWEGFSRFFQKAWNGIVNFAKGLLVSVKDLVVGLFSLAKGLICYIGSAVVVGCAELADVEPPKWAKDTFDGGNDLVSNIVRDPSIIAEGLAQGISDAWENDGAAYCVGYATGMIGSMVLADKGLSKLSKAGKAATSVDEAAGAGAAGAEELAGAGVSSLDDLLRMGVSSVDDLERLGLTSAEQLSKLGISSVDDLVRLGISSADDLERLGLTSAEALENVSITSAEDLVKAGIASEEDLAGLGIEMQSVATSGSGIIQNVTDLTEEQIKALNTYTGDNYVNINKSLRGLETATPENHATIDVIKSTLNNASLPEDMTLYRGTSTEALGALKGLSAQELVGKTFTESAFMSTSTDSIVATEGFTGNMQITIEASKGAKALDIAAISEYTTESEILFNAGQEMLITSAKIKDNILYITVLAE